MPRGPFNWNFDSVVKFLRKNGFTFNHVEGSHYFYSGGINKIVRNVCVPFHGKVSFKPKTLKGIISQSGIPESLWFGVKKKKEK